MKIVKLRGLPSPKPADRSDDGKDKMSPAARELIEWYGEVDEFGPDVSEPHLRLVKPETTNSE